MVRYALVVLFAIGVAAANAQQAARVSQENDALRAENERLRREIAWLKEPALHPDNEELRRKLTKESPAALRAENERLRQEIAGLKEAPAALGAENERLRQEIAGMKDAQAVPAVAEVTAAPPAAPRASTAPVQAAAAPGSHFRNARWGMTKKEVMQSETQNPRSDSDSILTYDDKVGSLEVIAGYVFENDVLARGTYLVTHEPANKNEYMDDYRHLVEALRKKYGKETDDRTIWSDRMFAKHPEDYGLAISMGQLAMITEWNTPDTKVLAALRGGNYEVKLRVEYASKKYLGIEKSTNNAADKDKL